MSDVDASVGAPQGTRPHGDAHAADRPVAFAAVGRTTFDAQGNVTGTQTASVGGSVATNTTKGNITVNPDCTGTPNVNLYDQAHTLLRTAVWAVV